MATAARPYHHGNLRAELLTAASRSLEDDGARALSLRGLARELGVSHAAPGRHFADKQALLDALAESGYQQLGETLDAAAAEAPAGFEPRLRALARAYVAFAAAHPALLELMFASKTGEGEAADRLHAAADRAFAAPLALIAEGQAAGEVVPGDVERVGIAAWATVHGIASMASTGMIADHPLDEIVDEAVQRAVYGLRPR